MVTTIITTPAAVTKDNSPLLPTIFNKAQTAIIGALIINCNPIARSISICVTSFVVLVIKLLVENFFISVSPKLSTFSNIFLRIDLENLADKSEVKYPITIVATKLPKAHNNMNTPDINISFIVLSSVCTNLVISLIYSGIFNSKNTENIISKKTLKIIK